MHYALVYILLIIIYLNGFKILDTQNTIYHHTPQIVLKHFKIANVKGTRKAITLFNIFIESQVLMVSHHHKTQKPSISNKAENLRRKLFLHIPLPGTPALCILSSFHFRNAFVKGISKSA